MYGYDDNTWEPNEEKFREAFGREMTLVEHRWFHSIWALVEPRKQEKRNAAAA